MMKKSLLFTAFAIISAAFLAGGVCSAAQPNPNTESAKPSGWWPKPPIPKPPTPPAPRPPDPRESIKNPALLSVFNDSRTLYYDQANLATRVSNIEQFLDTSATALGVLSTLNSDLKKLEIA
ncbi:MAG: hypothetical protein WC256_03570, partial [Desulfurivibrionaceae bacterium]